MDYAIGWFIVVSKSKVEWGCLYEFCLYCHFASHELELLISGTPLVLLSLCGAAIIGDSLKQKLDNLSDTVSDNVRGTGTPCCSICGRSVRLVQYL